MILVQEEGYGGNINMLYLTNLVSIHFKDRFSKHLKEMSEQNFQGEKDGLRRESRQDWEGS